VRLWKQLGGGCGLPWLYLADIKEKGVEEGTRWYRAPEILCGLVRFGIAADIWAAGCIFGEMMMGKVWGEGGLPVTWKYRGVCEHIFIYLYTQTYICEYIYTQTCRRVYINVS